MEVLSVFNRFDRRDECLDISSVLIVQMLGSRDGACYSEN